MNVGTVLSSLLGVPQGPAPEAEGAQGPPPAGALPAFGQLLALLSAHGGDPAAAEAAAGGTGEAAGNAGGPVTGEELQALLALLTGMGQGEVRLDRPAEAGRSREQEADDPPAGEGEGDGMTDGADYALLLALAAGVVLPPPATAPVGGLPGLSGEQPPEPGALPVPAHAGRAADGVPQGRPAVQAVEHAAAWAGVDPAAQGTETTGTAVHVTLGEDAPPWGESPPITARDLTLNGRTDAPPAPAAPAERPGAAPAALAAVAGPTGDVPAGAPAPPEAPPAAEPAGEPADRAAEAQRVIDQVAEAMEVLARDEGHEVRLRLRPPELGELHVRLDVRGATVTVSMAAEHEHVADLLRGHLPALREALHQREIHVDQALVWTGTSADSPWSGRGDGRGGTGERPPYAALPWEAPRAEPRHAPRPSRTDGERLVDYRI